MTDIETPSSPAPSRPKNLLAGLNDVQRKAVEHRDGPLVVFAGAGSGKTRIITHRIAWLIEQGVAPWEILAVTFTNKAAGEMRERVEAITPHGRRVMIATFHSACARWLREFAPELGFTSDFTIYDDSDSLAAVKRVLNELRVKLDEEFSAQDYKGAINKVKTMALLPSDDRLKNEWQDLMPPVGLQVYSRYQEFLAQSNAMDFGDLIMNLLLLLRRNERVRSVLQRRYRYLLIDEYQDTNRTQLELVSRLAAHHGNLFVVGDDDQSIYSWRGAVPSNIIDFDKVYPQAEKITLEQNYRCSSTIVDAANAMITNNKKRVPKRLFTDNPAGDLITFRLETDNDIEGWWVVDQIKSETSQFGYDKIAVFYRTNSQSRIMEDALRRENIPYRIYGTVRFYDRVEIKDLMAYLRLLTNPRDDLALKRVINTPPRGIGKKAIETLELEAGKREQGMLATMREMAGEAIPRISGKFEAFLELFDDVSAQVAESELADVTEILLKATDYISYVEKKYPEQAVDKIENIHELGAALAEFEGEGAQATVGDWLQSVTLASSEAEASNGVTLMTLHMAKGLEFPRVYILGLEEGLLPHRNSLDDAESLEEERRLFYVGMTRAMKKLSLTGAFRRRTFNTWSANQPSRFLTEIPSQYFESISEAERTYVESAFVSDPDEPFYDYADGDQSPDTQPVRVEEGASVRHPTYGRGIVEEVASEFGTKKATVRFDEFGLRKVMARHLT